MGKYYKVHDNVAAGFFIFLAIFIFWVVFWLPGTALTLAWGAIFTQSIGVGWGLTVGTLLGSLGQFGGGIAAYFIGKFLLYKCLRLINQKMILIK